MTSQKSRTFNLDELLRQVQKPGRYTGGEWNEIRKDPRGVKAKVGLVFPDVYEVGMSYLGQKILYAILNESPEILAERIFAPWLDFEQRLRATRTPLYSLENKTPLREFDILGFSLLYELNYSNILTILELGQIPFQAERRDLSFPLVIAGGPAAFNPEPLADIFDFFLIGDGEEAFPEIVQRYTALRKSVRKKTELLGEMARIRGVYVPSLYSPSTSAASGLVIPKPKDGAPAVVKKRTLHPFHRAVIPEAIVVPNIQVIHDRVAVEAARGCPQKCRFCQATNLYSPFRVKSPSHLVDKMLKSLRSTGYEDASLTALSISDYPYLDQTVKSLMGALSKQKIALSLSSLRPKGLSAEVTENIIQVRKTGLTLVPEAGTERLRRVINKHITEGEIEEAAANAFSRGWRLLKLYFMVGLPTEKEEDLQGIVSLVKGIVGQGSRVLGSPPRINLSVSSFIPKPHTPFQWLAMDDEQVLLEKQEFIRSGLRRLRSVEIKEHPIQTSLLEAAFSRGDRRLGAVLRDAWTRGARFDSWRDQFRFSVWEEAFAAAAISYHGYLGELDWGSPLPWDVVQTGIKKSQLLEELKKALREETTSPCLEAECRICRGCELAPFLDRKLPEEAIPPAKGQIAFGEPTPQTIRYRATYAKTGQARYLSHIDLINVLQRALRRAGIGVLQSEGFHPKMLISYLPALPLGLEAREEVLEFKAPFLLKEDSFVSHLNRHLPFGIEFTHLRMMNQNDPPLTRDVRGFVYSLDLGKPAVEEAVLSRARARNLSCPDRDSALRTLLEEYLGQDPDPAVDRLSLEPQTNRLVIQIRSSDSRTIRPQDLVEKIIGLPDSVYFLTREKIVFGHGAEEIDRSG